MNEVVFSLNLNNSLLGYCYQPAIGTEPLYTSCTFSGSIARGRVPSLLLFHFTSLHIETPGASMPAIPSTDADDYLANKQLLFRRQGVGQQ